MFVWIIKHETSISQNRKLFIHPLLYGNPGNPDGDSKTRRNENETETKTIVLFTLDLLAWSNVLWPDFVSQVGVLIRHRQRLFVILMISVSEGHKHWNLYNLQYISLILMDMKVNGDGRFSKLTHSLLFDWQVMSTFFPTFHPEHFRQSRWNNSCSKIYRPA